MYKMIIASEIGASFVVSCGKKYDKWFTYYEEAGFKSIDHAKKELHTIIAGIVGVYFLCYNHLKLDEEQIIEEVGHSIYKRGIIDLPRISEYAKIIEQAAGLCE